MASGGTTAVLHKFTSIKVQIDQKIDIQLADLQVLIVFWMGAQQGLAEVCHDVEIKCSCCKMHLCLMFFFF